MPSQELWLLLLTTIFLSYILVLIAAKFVSWILKRKYNIKLKIGRIGFLCLHDIYLQLRNGLRLEIEYAGFRSSLFHSNLKSFLVLCINDIRLQGDAEWMKVRTVSKQNVTEKKKSSLMQNKFPSIMKFISLRAQNASIMQLGKSDEEFLLHSSFQELNLYSMKNSDRIQFNITMSSSTLKILKHLPVDHEQKHTRESCICHFTSNLNITLQISLIDTSLKCVSIQIMQPELMLYEGFSVARIKTHISSGLKGKDSDQVLETPTINLGNDTMESKDPIKALQQVILKIPKETNLAVDSFSVKLMMEGGHRTFTFGVKSIDAHVHIENACDDELIPQVDLNLYINEIAAASDHFQIGQLLRLAFEGKITDQLLNMKFSISLFRIFHQMDVLQYLLSIASNTETKEAKTVVKRPPWNFKALKKYQIKAVVEVDDVFLSFKLPECNVFSFGLINGSFTSDHIITNCDSESLTEIIHSNLISSIELLLETAYLSMADTELTEHGMLKKFHFWNIPFSIGMILLKVRINQSDISLKCLMDSSQFQWSPNLVNQAQDVLNFFRSKVSSTAHTKRGKSKSPDTARSSKKLYSLEFGFTGLNVFGINEYETGIAVRTDCLNFNSSEGKSKVTLEGFKLVSINSVSQLYPCAKSYEIKTYDAYLKEMYFTYITKEKSASLKFSEDVFLQWSTTLHMTIFSLCQDIINFKNSFLPSEPPIDDFDANELVKNRKSDRKSFILKADGNIVAAIILSKEQSITFSSPAISASYNDQLKSASSDTLIVAFDNHKVFTFQKLHVSLAQGTDQHHMCRQGFDHLEKPNNRLLNIQFEMVKFLFPYKYNFANAFSEQFINLIKWLKNLHKSKKTAFTIESPLPPDLLITTKSWIIELEDDLFEVKLRDNFELLEDEYHESLKRKKMLEENIETLLRKNLLLQSEKINLLYSKLAKKDAEIYIKRSRQLYDRGPMRTSLCTWILDDVEILAIADTSYHGTEHVVDIMKQIDFESPYPEEGIEFSTLWGRKVRCSVLSWMCQLRDFPQPLLQIRELHFWGFLIGAEQEASQRAKRSSTMEINPPWSNATVERSMPSLKFYHDLTFDMEEMSMAYGPSWEPVMAQISLMMEQVSRPSLDPSPALPWWDKMRLLYHGRLTISAQHLALLLRASLDPYNTTEQMEINWSEVIIEWTNGKVLTKGNLDMYVHTASKYDDCRVLHIPSLKLSINLNWLCLGNPYDHHNVMPCAPDKVPEYSINQEHDSYRAFRSQNLNISYSYETKQISAECDDIPTMLLYSSTLRWIENLKMILSGVTRLTKRGKLFSNTKPRKPQLGRHYHILRISLNLHKFKIFYWMSFAKQRGLELVGGRLFLSSEHTQTLAPVSDGLNHRPCANWNIGYLNSELSDSEIWLCNCAVDGSENPTKSFQAPVERSYFLSVNRVSYGREEIGRDVVSEEADTPTHRLVVHGLKGAWTKHNRLVTFSLFDSYVKTVILKKNLSTEALKGFKVDTQNTPQKLRSQTNASQTSVSAASSPLTNLQSSHAASMLQKLVAESEANPMVFTEDIEGSTREQQLHGVAACQTDDVLQKKWLIELVNSQVMLRGCETSGYVIVSAAKAQILQRVHRPVWKDRSLVSKTTWVGSFECMQYYATVDAGAPSPSTDDVMWLSIDNIEERESMVISDLPDLVGSGHSVGGVVSSTVGGASDPKSAPIQLQRIVSRCGCQFFYASFGENVETSILDEVPPLPEDIDILEQEVAVDSFTLTHHDLDICTNSLQYAMILDLVNNLLLYVEPRKKEAIEKLQYMRFQLQLCSVEDQRGPILQLQENIRSLVSNLRRLEKQAYAVHKLLCENPNREDFFQELQLLESRLYEHKEQLNTMNDELTIMISCFKETQIIACKSRQRASSQEKGITVARRSEVCFKHAQWRLTDADGQLGIADLVLSNFLYSKVSKTDESVEHLLEIGYVKMTNLLPNQAYKNVLQPTDVQTKIPLDRQRLLRIYCREKAPVGGISIKEHLEVNVIPITIGLTDAFYKAMLKFFFPGRDTEKADDHTDDDLESAGSSSKKSFKPKGGTSTFYGERDDIEKMKERADKNHTFFSIKIPAVPLRISYKGKKEKNIEDVHNLSLILSSIEYHNRTWTWLDLLMALKNDAKRILLSQAIKQKLLQSNRRSPERENQPQEEEKATLLLGPQRFQGRNDRTLKKGLLSRIRRDNS